MTDGRYVRLGRGGPPFRAYFAGAEAARRKIGRDERWTVLRGDFETRSFAERAEARRELGATTALGRWR